MQTPLIKTNKWSIFYNYTLCGSSDTILFESFQFPAFHSMQVKVEISDDREHVVTNRLQWRWVSTFFVMAVMWRKLPNFGSQSRDILRNQMHRLDGSYLVPRQRERLVYYGYHRIIFELDLECKPPGIE